MFRAGALRLTFALIICFFRLGRVWDLFPGDSDASGTYSLEVTAGALRLTFALIICFLRLGRVWDLFPGGHSWSVAANIRTHHLLPQTRTRLGPIPWRSQLERCG
ncbi:hypothetical protein EXIGLDRAFT_777627 [Exidia glandulosa HHB12029]|uniref:Uncharacterized protein n=1 Tax=Exidia glandulosa HHB12029 TaxID=1314781 RepID=A0A165ZK33_EXIGL|nr:hypothetical protein EXIGLDRAFT_777627 [Exidia glandulosa HHB12029]